jgi:SAM-dependent methyltransferase
MGDGGDRNLEIYSAPEIVRVYAARAGLHPAEELAFGRYAAPASAILDIGVGGGRTTPYLAARASSYVGIDYSSGMVEACRERFPGLSFLCETACDLGRFPDGSFDLAVFSFNGLANIPSDRERRRALGEISRVLKRGGRFVFSLPHARGLAVWPIFDGGNVLWRGWRSAQAVGRTIGLVTRRLFSPVFARGAGYAIDPAHGGLVTYYATPETVRAEVEAAGLTFVEMINGYHPINPPRLLTPWYYNIHAKL